MYITHSVQFDKEDATLLDLVSKGDNTAFGTIYNKYANQLLSYGIGLGFDRDTVKDAVQDVFYQVYTSRESWVYIKSLKSYLLKSLKNRLINLYKSKGDVIDLEQDNQNFSVKVTVLDELIDNEDRLHVQLEVEKYLNCLTSRQREAVYLRFIQELEYEEIGEMLDMTPHGARKLVSRAVIRMRNQSSSLYILLLSLNLFRL